MSLIVVPFESLGAVSYSPSMVTVAVSVAVCEIFSVKEWRDHKNQVEGRSRSHGHTVVTSVVRATRRVNGRRQTYPSHHTHTP